MRNTDILNVNQYPVATFDIKSAVPLEKKSRRGNPLYELSGEFTLRGRKGTIRFEAEVNDEYPIFRGVSTFCRHSTELLRSARRSGCRPAANELTDCRRPLGVRRTITPSPR